MKKGSNIIYSFICLLILTSLLKCSSLSYADYGRTYYTAPVYNNGHFSGPNTSSIKTPYINEQPSLADKNNSIGIDLDMATKQYLQQYIRISGSRISGFNNILDLKAVTFDQGNVGVPNEFNQNDLSRLEYVILQRTNFDPGIGSSQNLIYPIVAAQGSLGNTLPDPSAILSVQSNPNLFVIQSGIFSQLPAQDHLKVIQNRDGRQIAVPAFGSAKQTQLTIFVPGSIENSDQMPVVSAPIFSMFHRKNIMSTGLLNFSDQAVNATELYLLSFNIQRNPILRC